MSDKATSVSSDGVMRTTKTKLGRGMILIVDREEEEIQRSKELARARENEMDLEEPVATSVPVLPYSSFDYSSSSFVSSSSSSSSSYVPTIADSYALQPM